MEVSAQLLDSQKKTGETIQQIIRNFKKDSSDRKSTTEYYKERIRRLTEAWNQFEDQDTKLRVLSETAELATEHEYFTKNFYTKISELTNSYLETFKIEANRLKTLEEKQQRFPDSEIIGAASTNQQNTFREESTSHQGLIRQITARMAALKRFVNGLSHMGDSYPRQYYQIKIDTINKLWSQIQNLHDDIWDKFKEPSTFGFNIDEYYTLEDAVQNQLVNLTVITDKLPNTDTTKSTTELSVRGSLPLPKVTIPQFNGDYLKWRQFHDLFSEMVDKQSIPAIQKMWYLKTNVSGEAEHLISQYALTDGNYSTAWKALQDRYNNKRVLVANLVEKILNQSAGTSSASAIKNLHDTTKECLLALNNIGIKTCYWDALLLQLLIKKNWIEMHISGSCSH